MNANNSYVTHYFYQRYKWLAADFLKMQTSEVGLPMGIAEGLLRAALLEGGDAGAATGLNISVAPYIAVSPIGDLLACSTTKNITVVDDPAQTVSNLVVVRAVKTDIDYIKRPTSPFDTVPLRSLVTPTLVVISGTPGGGYPSAASGDTILFGAQALNGTVTSIDLTKCDLAGKNGELRWLRKHNVLVGNHRHCTVKDLNTAVFVAGDRVRVVDSQTLSSTVNISVNDVEIEFDPGVTITKGAATGVSITGLRVALRGGLFQNYTLSTDVPVAVLAAASGGLVADSVFSNCTNTIVDLTTGIRTYGIIQY